MEIVKIFKEVSEIPNFSTKKLILCQKSRNLFLDFGDVFGYS